MKNIYNICVSVFASGRFLWAIVTLFVFESLWIAFSFHYPLVYDEAFHLPVIKIFSHQWLPLLFNQPHSADQYGNLMYDGGPLYHYIMSFPFRIIVLFTNNFAIQVIMMRVLNVLMAAAGLLLFNRLFRKIGIKQIFINISLLIFILIPLVPFVAATINYDNMLFPLTAWYLILCIRLLKSTVVDWREVVSVVIVGCLTTLVKEAFLPIFAASIIYLIVAVFRKHGRRYLNIFFASIKKTQKPHLVVYLVLFITFVGLFSVRYIQPIVLYHTPTPDCAQTTSSSRCLDYSSSIIAEKFKTRDQRSIEELPDYATMWFSSNLNSTGRVVAVGPGWGDYQPPLPVINILLFISIVLGIGILLYTWRTLEKGPAWYFLTTMTVTLVVVTFIFNYSLYLKLHYPFAIQPRYLLNFTPIIIVMVVVACNDILKKYKITKLSVLIVVLLLFTQGGGTISYILRSKDFWYWGNAEVIKANHFAKKILAPIVKEN